jgi:hypothetical protein
MQATPCRKVNVAPLGLGVGSTVHLVPVQPSARETTGLPAVPSLPTATHAVPGHDTASNADAVTPAGWTGFSASHFDPFHSWLRANPLSPCPTARQAERVAQASAASCPFMEVGVVTATHFVPFHCSVSVPTASLGTSRPTAQHSAAAGQAMPASTLSSPGTGLGLGLGTTAHFDPFQCSVSVLESAQPLAQQSVALTHETADRAALEAPEGSGTLTGDHFDPFQCPENGISPG